MGTFSVVDARPTLPVTDVAASVAWYQRVLGVSCEITMGDPVSFALLDVPGGHLVALAACPMFGVLPFAVAYLNVVGVDVAYDHCVAAGATVVEPPTTHPWGQRDFVIADPDGHLLALGEHVGPS